jgi:hypothetical protein
VQAGQQVLVPGQQQQQVTVGSAAALQGAAVATAAATATPAGAADMRLGQQAIERQLQQLQAAARKMQWAPCTANSQAKQYPGAELIQQRLQLVGNTGATVPQLLPGQATPSPVGSAGLAQLSILAGAPMMQQGVTTPGASGAPGINPATPRGLLTQQQQQLMSGILGPPPPQAASSNIRPAPASTGNMGMAAGGSGMINAAMAASAQLTGSSYNKLQQLVKQAAAGAALSGPSSMGALGVSPGQLSGMSAVSGPMSVGSAGLGGLVFAAQQQQQQQGPASVGALGTAALQEALGRSSAPGDAAGVNAAAAAAGSGGGVTGGPASSSAGMAALSSLLGMAEGAEQLLQLPTSPTAQAAGKDAAAITAGESRACCTVC